MKKQKQIRLGAHTIVESFKRNGVTKVFIYPGGTIAPILDIIEKETNIEIVCPRNEQGAGYAALAYAKITGKPAVYMVTSGPGVTNAITPVADAYYDNIPMVVITGQVGTAELRGKIPVKQRGFQEVDTVDVLTPVTKAAFLATNADELSEMMERAFLIARTGRGGPVVIDMPMNIQRAILSKRVPKKFVKNISDNPLVSKKKIATLADWITKAERPVILAGGGVIAARAHKELRTLADRFAIPVTMSLPGIGAYPSEKSLSLGLCGYVGSQYANLALHSADLIIALGTTLHVRQTGSIPERMAPQGKVARIDIDTNELAHSRVPLNLSIHADIRGALVTLNSILAHKTYSKKRQMWLDTIAEWKHIHALTPELPRGVYLKPQKVIQWASDVLKGDVIVATGVGQHQMWVPRHFSFSYPSRQLLTSSGHGTMGFDLPAAIGAKIASPHATVLCVVGDGSFQMNIQELATISERKLDIKILVLDNHALNIVAQFQRQNWKSHPATGGKYNPDFARIARAYGIHAITVSSARGAQEKITEALKRKGPVLIHCDIDPKEDLLPMLLGGHELNDMSSTSSFE